MPKKAKKSIIHPKQETVHQIEGIAAELREIVIKMLLDAGSGHSAGPLGTADIFAALYFHILNFDPKNPHDPDRDRFVLSNGHICPIWYASLYKLGLLEKKELKTLRRLESRLQGHPHYQTIAGLENTGGPLGQGLSQAIGMALAAKMDSKDYRVYCMTGDGELNEGQIWEAALFAPAKNLNNLVWIVDRNNIQIDGYTENVMPLATVREKLEAFNWFVIEIDGHNIEEIINACEMAKAVSQRPTAIVAHTIPGKGVDFMQYKFEWHGKPPNKEQAREALKQLRTLEGKITHAYE
jgi:transketolase